ncbi:MAG: P63C domain-containing protein [Planctomycetaceae bacterium]|nr:P63C domain-containing protein [Planctomycetaceae bacterium]
MSDEVVATESPVEEVVGKAKGGAARAAKLTAKVRREIASKAAKARWGDDDAPVAVCGSPDKPLVIGEVELPCYVLEDGRRVLHQRGMVDAIGMSRGSSGGTGGDRLAKFVAGDRLKEFVPDTLRSVTENPIRFRTPAGALAYGYEATVLADICEAVLSARQSGLLQKQQEHIAKQCEILMRGFARVGIIALVDEATGYQEFRERDALSRILEAFVAKEIQPYIQTFDPLFYRELFRLRGLEFPRDSVRRPQYFGVLTNDIVYKRLAPGVLDELRKITPRNESGRRKHKYFQRLTTNLGYPKLKEHLGAVVAIMQLSQTWDDFMHNLDRLRPRYDKPLMLPFPEYDQESDDGKGI